MWNKCGQCVLNVGNVGNVGNLGNLGCPLYAPAVPRYVCLFVETCPLYAPAAPLCRSTGETA